MAKELFPVLKIALVDQKPSGFVREDTVGSKNPIEKSCPATFYIPEKGGEGIRYVKIDEKRNRKVIGTDEALEIIASKGEGYENIIPEKYAIRYIKGCPEISVDWQKANNWQPSTDPHSDVILIEDGYAEFNHTADPVKYRYIKELMWNADLINRLGHIQPMYYEIKESKKDALEIDLIMARQVAMEEWTKLVIKGKTGNTYNEEKISGYAELLGVSGRTTTDKLTGLYTKLNQNPTLFAEKVKAYNEETTTQISHALSLKLLNFEGNSAVLFNEKRIELGNVGSKSSKMERLSDILKTSEYKETYVALVNQIQLAKEKQLN